MSAPEFPSTEVMQAIATEVGACIRPIMRRLIDTTTGEATLVPIPCGATWTGHCPPCAERNRKLRATQCREGWHLDEDPIPVDDLDEDVPSSGGEPDAAASSTDDAQGQGDDDVGERRTRSTRRRDDMPGLPERLPVELRSLGRVFVSSNGKSYRPSMFVTITLGSYGAVHEDGTPVDPDTYDYRRQVLDAMHFGKLFDRIMQNLRRSVGYRVQYFAAVEPQRRLAPHLHMAARGAMARKTIKQVVRATYATVWWPSFDEPVYSDPTALPVWEVDDFGEGRFTDPETAHRCPPGTKP